MRVGLPLLAGALLHRGNPYRGMDRQRVWDDVASAPLGDDSHLYSNLGMAALGQALAERQGYSYEELLTRRVLAPLGMTDAPAFAGFSPPPGTADGHGTNLESTHAWRLEGFAPAGGLHANGEAMQRYLRANLAGTAPGGTLALEPRVFPEDGRGVGLAWMVFERRGRTVTGHNGGTGGFRSFIGFDRSAGEGVFVLANSGNSVDRVGASLLHTAAAPKPPRAGVLAPVVAVLLAAWGALATAGARAPRLDRLIGDRADALRRLVLVVCVLAFSWESVDLRAWPPAVVVGVAALTIGLHAAALARSRPAAPRPLAARLWQGLVLVMVLWAALVSPRVG
jgi:CubicO group peptidase (beta-lactamase class C family)